MKTFLSWCGAFKTIFTTVALHLATTGKVYFMVSHMGSIFSVGAPKFNTTILMYLTEIGHAMYSSSATITSVQQIHFTPASLTTSSSWVPHNITFCESSSSHTCSSRQGLLVTMFLWHVILLIHLHLHCYKLDKSLTAFSMFYISCVLLWTRDPLICWTVLPRLCMLQNIVGVNSCE